MNESTTHYFAPAEDADFTPREITATLAGNEHTVLTTSHVFSPDGLDRGTQVLLKSLPKPPNGSLLDIGCGWGAISLDAALSNPGTNITAIDVNERALKLTELNAERLGLKNITASLPENVDPNLRFTEIRSNPPIRVGKKALHEILETWLPRLESSGSAYLVVAKKLGAESLREWITTAWPAFTVELWDRQKGFHVLRVTND